MRGSQAGEVQIEETIPRASEPNVGENLRSSDGGLTVRKAGNLKKGKGKGKKTIGTGGVSVSSGGGECSSSVTEQVTVRGDVGKEVRPRSTM